MTKTRALREIVASLRGLVLKARGAGAPVAGDVLTMAAGAVNDIAKAEESAPARRPEQVTKRLGEG